MTTRKDRQYNENKKEGQTIQWPQERKTENKMTTRKKDRQYNDHKKEGQTI